MSRFFRFIHSRAIHSRVPLPYNIEHGLGDFLPPSALKTVAVDYQQGLLQNLNDQVRGTELQDKSIVDTIVRTATSRDSILAFNYASLALNNHFFLERLKPPPAENNANHQHEISLALAEAIRSQHGSIAQFKSTFSAACMGMFSSGFVWFVTDTTGQTAVVPTFGPGSMLIRSRKYMGDLQVAQQSEMLVFNNRGGFMDLENGPFAAEHGVQVGLDAQNMVKENPALAAKFLGDEPTKQMLNHEKLSQMMERDPNLVNVLKDSGSLAERMQKDPELAKVIATYFSQFLHEPIEEEPVQEEEQHEEEQEPPSKPPSSSSSNLLHPRFFHTSARALQNSMGGNYSPASPYTSRDDLTRPSTAPPPTGFSSPTYTSQSRRASKAYLLGETLYPLFCISIHEHAWMSAGFGVNGKEEYVKRFWSVVDWQKVSEAYNQHVEPHPRFRDSDDLVDR